MASGGLALVRANARYWPTVAPLTARQLRRWEARAGAIPDPALRGLALSKLRDEHFNAQVATTLATPLPRPARADVVTALVALEVAYDYLDGLTELPAEDPLASARDLFAAITDALDLASSSAPPESRVRFASRLHDEGYLGDLSAAIRGQLSELSAWPLICEVAHSAAGRTAEAQARIHAARSIGTSQLREWAAPLAQAASLDWREFLAGAAASVLACHALIVAAADPHTTRRDAECVDAFYLRLCALSTLLDAVIDRDTDRAAGEDSMLRFYPERQELADALCSLARDARSRAEALPDGPHHLMIMVGVVAYYTSAPQARSTFARPLVEQVWAELSPLIFPTLAVMRAWRAAKRLRALTRGRGTAPSCARSSGYRRRRRAGR